MRTIKIALLPGDGIGPEVTSQAQKVLTQICTQAGLPIQVDTCLVGGQALDAGLPALPNETLSVCRSADAILLGAVGGPQWDQLPASNRPESALLQLRSSLALFANLRPIHTYPALHHCSSLRPKIIKGVDLLIVRELTGGLYFGPNHATDETAFDTMVYTKNEITRVAKRAFELARSRQGRLVSVDKANVLRSSQLWRETVNSLASNYPEVNLTHAYIDSFAYALVSNPIDFDVILTENLFGDILSDEAAALTGSLGILPSASLGSTSLGLYEPVHGSAPSLVGTQQANPLGTILSVALLFRHSLNHPDLALQIERAVDQVIHQGDLTPDLGGTSTTSLVAESVLAQIAKQET